MISLIQEQLHLVWPTPGGHSISAYGVRAQSCRHRQGHDGEGHAIDAGAAAADHDGVNIFGLDSDSLSAEIIVLQQQFFIQIHSVKLFKLKNKKLI